MTGHHTVTGRDSAERSADELRRFPIVDRWFIVFIVLELVAFASVPLLPLGVAAAGFATPLRTSRWRIIVLCILGLLLGLIVAAPTLLRLLDLQLVDNGSVQTIPAAVRPKS